MIFGYTRRRAVYETIPLIVRKAGMILPFSFWAGRHYRATLRRDRFLDMADSSTLDAYRNHALGDVLHFAVDQVPAYRSMRHVVDRYSPQDALKEFPFLDKDYLQNHMQDYLPRDFDSMPHYAASTGGTSGNQLQFYLDDYSQSMEMGFMHRLWKRIGYRPSCRKATFRGVEFTGLRTGEYWRENPVYNEMQFSPFHMSESNLAAYCARLKDYRPEFLHGYPSAISILAEFVLRNPSSLGKLMIRSVLLGSESATLGQRALIEKAFNCRVYSWFGHSERVLLAGECERCDAYHQLPDYGIVEIVGESGQAVQPGQKGELIGTGLINRCLPLIRYRTGDFARKLDDHCECGRFHQRFDQVEGRWAQEFVVGKSGSRMSLAALNPHGNGWEHVLRYQYFQERCGNLELRLVVSPAFSEADMAAVQNTFRKRIGDELLVSSVIVKDIALTDRGKIRRLLQKIPDKNNLGEGCLAG